MNPMFSFWDTLYAVIIIDKTISLCKVKFYDYNYDMNTKDLDTQTYFII